MYNPSYSSGLTTKKIFKNIINVIGRVYRSVWSKGYNFIYNFEIIITFLYSDVLTIREKLVNNTF